MKTKLTIKFLSVIICIILLVSTVSAMPSLLAENIDTSKTKEISIKESVTDKEENAPSKSETVYVIANADGSVKKIIVSDWLKNSLNDTSIKDYTDLQNVTNVKGDESYTMNSDNMRVWDAKGSDIYYQGVIEKELPVNISISYKLDGKTVSAEELVGKSGKVTMHFDYKNNEFQTVEIDGQKTKIYVPFVMITGMILDNDCFTNVAISNGKIINDGTRSFVVGFALPGIQENLDIPADKFEIPSSVEITADVKDFALSTTMTFATNEMFNELDFKDVDNIDDIESSLTKLKDASKQLIDGSSALYDGLTTLLTKSDELIAGIDKLAAGAQALNKGADTLNNKTDELNQGVKSIADGLNTLVGYNNKLNNGAKTVFESLLSTSNLQLAAAGITVPKLTIENYNIVLNSVLDSISEENVTKLANATALAQVTEAVNEQKSVIKSQVELAVKAKVLEGVLKAAGQNMTAEEYAQAVAAGHIPEAMQTQINTAVTAQMKTSAVQAQIDAATEAQIQTIITEQMKSEQVVSQINAAKAKAEAGRNSIKALIIQLDSYNEFYTGLLTYTDGVSTAAGGSNQLSEGCDMLKDGTQQIADASKQLNDGLKALKDKSPALKDGISQLKDGAMQLSDGMKEFNDTGIQKLIGMYDGNVKGFITRLKATIDVSKSYQSFAGISEDMDGSVKFVYKTSSIGK